MASYIMDQPLALLNKASDHCKKRQNPRKIGDSLFA